MKKLISITFLLLSSIAVANDFKIKDIATYLPFSVAAQEELIKYCGELDCTAGQDVTLVLLNSGCLNDSDIRKVLPLFEGYYFCPAQ